MGAGSNRGRVGVIGDERLGGRGMKDQTRLLPGTLAEFLNDRLPRCKEPPDAE